MYFNIRALSGPDELGSQSEGILRRRQPLEERPTTEQYENTWPTVCQKMVAPDHGIQAETKWRLGRLMKWRLLTLECRREQNGASRCRYVGGIFCPVPSYRWAGPVALARPLHPQLYPRPGTHSTQRLQLVAGKNCALEALLC